MFADYILTIELERFQPYHAFAIHWGIYCALWDICILAHFWCRMLAKMIAYNFWQISSKAFEPVTWACSGEQ